MIDKQLTQDYFDDLAEKYSVNEHQDNINKWDVFFEKLKSKTEAPRIIECGAGGGFYTLRFLKSGYDVISVDLSQKALEVNTKVANENAVGDHLKTYCGDFNQVITENEIGYDQAVFIKVLHHFDNLHEIQKALKSAYKQLQSGGRVVIFEPNGRNVLWQIFLSLEKDPVSGKSKWHIEKNLKLTTVKNLTKVFKDLGVNYKVNYQ